MSLQYQKEKLDENIEGIKASVGEFKDTYFDEDTEWNEGLGKKAWYPIKKIGDVTDHVMGNLSLRDQLQIAKDRDLLPGQTFDDAILDYSAKDLRDDTAGGIGNVAGFVAKQIPGVSDKRAEQINDAFELGGQIILPDITDVATGGLGYVDNLAKAAKQLRKFDAKAASKMVDEVFNAKRFTGELTNLKNSAVQKVEEVTDAIKAPFNTIKTAVTGGLDIGTARDVSGGRKYVQGELPLRQPQSIKYKEKVSSLMNDFGMPDGVFDLRTYDLRKSLNTPTQRRVFLEHYLSPDFIKGRFSGFDKANRPEFAAKWADFLTAKGLNPVGDVQIHHINPLYDSIHLFDGVKFDSDEYWNIIETLIDGNARTGAIYRSEDVNNLMMTLGKGKTPNTPHGIAHKYLNTQTPTFFSKAEMKLMKADPAYRIQKARDWAIIVNKSEQVILEAHKQWKLLNPKIASKLSFDELVDTLSEYTDQGYSKLLSPEYQLPDFNRIITQIANDKGLKGPIFRLQPPPIDKSRTTLREQMIREADIAKETKLADKQLRELQNPKPNPNPDQLDLPL